LSSWVKSKKQIGVKHSSIERIQNAWRFVEVVHSRVF